MKAIQILPNDYKTIFSVNLQKDKKIAVFINILAIIITAVLAVPMHFYIPITSLFDMQNGLLAYSVRFISLMILLIVYMILHEFVHGIAMKICGTQKVKYGFTGLYAFAGSDDYYDKKSYMMIALAPIILLGIIIAVINTVVPTEWFWVIYFIQICNISGAAGDMYVTVKFMRFPNDILVRDSGVEMTVYSKQSVK